MSKNKLSICLKLIFVLAIASTLFSCRSQSVNLETLDPNLYDQSWLTGKPCGAPCWYGLEPGVSSLQKSVSTVKQLPFISGEIAALTNSREVSFSCGKPQDFDCVYMAFKNDKLEVLDFSPNYQITFEQAVEKLGSPDGFSVHLNSGDVASCELQVIWRNRSLVLQYDTGLLPIISFGSNTNADLCDDEGKRTLPKGILVQYVKIMLPSEIQSMTQGNPDFVPWKGFAK
jgi:hypothetical protein